MTEDLGQGAGKRAIKIAGETGIASIYGFPGDKNAGGTKTANGEDIRPTDMSAAHKSIPFGTRVRVTNLVNGLSAIVRIKTAVPSPRAASSISHRPPRRRSDFRPSRGSRQSR